MNNQQIKIRRAKIEDLEALTDLLVELFEIEKDFSPDAFLQREGLKQLMHKPGAIILVADQGKEVLGMCTIQTVISTAEGGPVGLFEDMIINKKYRKNGIGRLLIQAAENWAKEKNLKRLQLLAESQNHNALAFYSKVGWKRTGLICLKRTLR